MTEEQLAELEALANAATDGPWTVKKTEFEDAQADAFFDDVYTVEAKHLWEICDISTHERMNEFAVYSREMDRADAAFIAAARTAVPDLIAEVRRLRGLLQRCDPFLEHLLACNWMPPEYPCDCGLAKLKAEIGGDDAVDTCGR